MFKWWEWQQKRWQVLLERRQNIEPARNTKNGHRVAMSSGCVISIPKDDECFKSMSFVVSEKKFLEL